MFDTCVNNLAIKGRLVVVGAISGYQNQSAWKSEKASGVPLPQKLLAKSASVRGVFFPHYPTEIKQYSKELIQLMTNGKLISKIDDKKFVGVEQIADAIDYMYSGKNIGKVVVQISQPQSKL